MISDPVSTPIDWRSGVHSAFLSFLLTSVGAQAQPYAITS
jgi:hypothetical protein